MSRIGPGKPAVRRRKTPLSVWVGIDFGTHSTKVAFAELTRHYARALVFDHELTEYPCFCFPSLVWISNDARLLLGPSAARRAEGKRWDAGVRHLKMLVAGRYDERFCNPITEQAFARHLEEANADPNLYTPERICAAFLACVMREARQQLRRETAFAGSALDLRFNVCVPIDHLEEQAVRGVFERIALQAELLERKLHPEENLRELPVSVLLRHEGDPGMVIPEEERRVTLIPEAVAQAASYVAYQGHQDGIHALVDIGAGTADVSIFLLTRPQGQLQTTWYASRAIPWGMAHVEHRLAEDLLGRACSTTELKDLLEGEAAKTPRIQLRISKELERFRESREYKEVWKSAYRHYIQSSQWEERPLFLSGGGSELASAKKVLAVPWWSNLETRHEVMKLPIPTDFDSANGRAPFHRLEVAYGLTIPKPSLDKFVLPKSAPDHTPDMTPRRLPDRDELYPK